MAKKRKAVVRAKPKKKKASKVQSLKIDLSGWDLDENRLGDLVTVEKSGSVVTIELELGESFDKITREISEAAINMYFEEACATLTKDGIYLQSTAFSKDNALIPWEGVSVKDWGEVQAAYKTMEEDSDEA